MVENPRSADDLLRLAEKNVHQLRERKDRLVRKLESIVYDLSEAEAAVRYFHKLLGTQPGVGVANGNGNAATYADDAVAIVVARGGRATVAEVLADLQARGRDVTYATVYSALNRDGRFRKLARGVFVVQNGATMTTQVMPDLRPPEYQLGSGEDPENAPADDDVFAAPATDVDPDDIPF